MKKYLYSTPLLVYFSILLIGAGAAAQPVWSLHAFGTATVAPELRLNGAGTNIDSIAFWETPDPQETLMFVTGKDNNLIEIWKYPFVNNQLPPLNLPTSPNGVDVDQDRNWLLIGDSGDRGLKVFSLPNLQLLKTIGKGIIGAGETNLDVLDHRNGQKWVYVSDDHAIHTFNLDTGNFIKSFSPNVQSIEEMVADSFHQVLYIPDEQGKMSTVNPGGIIFAFNPDGTPYTNGDTNSFGYPGIFSQDEEGTMICTCQSNDGKDDGRGFIVVTDQSMTDNGYEFFHRQTWEHLGTLEIEGVSNTDGIASTQRTLPGYPMGVMAVVNNDRDVAVVGWDVILEATGLSCADSSSQPEKPANLRYVK